MWYVLWLVVTPTLMAVATYYGFKWGSVWAIDDLGKEMVKWRTNPHKMRRTGKMRVEKVKNTQLNVSSELTDSGVFIKRHGENLISLSIATRDNSGEMHIESVHIEIDEILGLDKGQVKSYRSPTKEERG